MEKVLISNEDEAAKMGRELSDNLYYEDNFTIPAFVRFCKALPPILRVQYYSDDFLEREKHIHQGVSIHFLDRPPIIVDLCSDWFIDVHLKDRGFVCDFTTITKIFKRISK